MSSNQPVDTLITHSIVVTMNPRREVLTDGAVAIRGRKIVAVGKTADLQARLAGREVLEDRLYREVQQAGEAICRRTGLPDKSRWPLI